LSEGYDLGRVGDVGGLPDCDNFFRFVTGFVCWEVSARCSLGFFHDVMPHADCKAILGRFGHAMPVHVSAALLNDPGKQAEVCAFLSNVFEREVARRANEAIGGGGIDEFVDLGVWEVVREQNGCKAVK
jgi:hypothetical protein